MRRCHVGVGAVDCVRPLVRVARGDARRSNSARRRGAERDGVEAVRESGPSGDRRGALGGPHASVGRHRDARAGYPVQDPVPVVLPTRLRRRRLPGRHRPPILARRHHRGARGARGIAKLHPRATPLDEGRPRWGGREGRGVHPRLDLAVLTFATDDDGDDQNQNQTKTKTKTKTKTAERAIAPRPRASGTRSRRSATPWAGPARSSARRTRRGEARADRVGGARYWPDFQIVTSPASRRRICCTHPPSRAASPGDRW